MIERTLILIKPCAVQRAIVGDIINRFERKGLKLAGLKMIQLTEDVLNEHYAHLSTRPFFQQIKNSMMATPVIAICCEGVDAVQVVRNMAGSTNGRNATLGTIRGDYSMSSQENVVHTSDSPENAEVELRRFFNPCELFDYKMNNMNFIYAADEF